MTRKIFPVFLLVSYVRKTVVALKMGRNILKAAFSSFAIKIVLGHGPSLRVYKKRTEGLPGTSPEAENIENSITKKDCSQSLFCSKILELNAKIVLEQRAAKQRAASCAGEYCARYIFAFVSRLLEQGRDCCD